MERISKWTEDKNWWYAHNYFDILCVTGKKEQQKKTNSVRANTSTIKLNYAEYQDTEVIISQENEAETESEGLSLPAQLFAIQHRYRPHVFDEFVSTCRLATVASGFI